MTLLHRIEAHMRAMGQAPSRFGREAIKDPRLVAGLRNGRRVRAATLARIEAYMAAAAGDAR